LGANGSFWANLNAQLYLSVVNGNGSLYISNNSMTVDSYLNVFGATFRVYGSLYSNGTFSITAQAGPWSWGTCWWMAVVNVCFGASFQASITVRSSWPYVELSAYGSAWMDGQSLSCWWGGWHDSCLRCGWGGWGRWINAGIGFNTSGSIYVDLWGHRLWIR